jgi:predicted dehydrogenase
MTLNPPPTTIGIIGTGQIGSEVHIPVLRAMDGMQIEWIADANRERAGKVAAAHRLKSVDLSRNGELLPAAGIVLIALPLPPRARYFEALKESCAAVLAEKPLTTTAQEHLELMSAFPAWRLSVGYQRRTYATSRFLRQAIMEGFFGAPRSISVREGGRMTRAGDGGAYQDESVANGGGVVKNLGCHSLDLMLWITNAASYSVMDRKIAWDGATDRRASAQIQLNGSSASGAFECPLDWTVSWIDAQPNSIEVEFDGIILSAPIAPSLTLAMKSRKRTKLASIDATATGGAGTARQAFFLEWQEVAASARERRASSLSAASCLLTAQLMDELLRT